MSAQNLETGTGEGYLARVDADGNLYTRRSCVALTPYISNTTLGGTSATILTARTGRCSLQIQNLGANNAYIDLEGGTAATTDILLAPGATYTLPAGVSVEGEITGISPTGGAQVVAVEFVHE